MIAAIDRFQPTLPLRGATPFAFKDNSAINVFQPTLPLRGATSLSPRVWSTATFQPTLPLRGATTFHALYGTFK